MFLVLSLVDLESSTPGVDALPPHKFRVGDIVGIEEHASSGRSGSSASSASARRQAAAAAQSSSNNETNSPPSLQGVVTRISDSAITIAFNDDYAEKLPDRCRLYKLANNITYERMSDAMKALEKVAGSNDTAPDLVQRLFGIRKPEFSSDSATSNSASSDATDSIKWFDTGLNASQREAVRFSLSAKHLALIHGPPGTGKTYTCVELVRQLVQRGERVLICGPSNISVDNLVERLAKCKLDIVRLGHPARILDQVVQHALDVRVRSSDEGQIVNDVRREVDKTLQSASKARNKTERRQMYQDVKALRKELKVRERTVVDTIVRNAQVILTTLNGAATKTLQHEQFDTVLIDEAAQALEAECWIAILKAKRLILAGDHLQLPPTVKSISHSNNNTSTSKSASRKSSTKTTPKDTKSISTSLSKLNLKDGESPKLEASLEVTLFDRLLEMYGPSIKRLLNVQYRMNEKIMAFSSKELYEGRLVAHESVKDRLLSQVDGVKSNDDTTIPVIFIDTSGQDMRESLESDAGGSAMQLGGDSKFNTSEADIVVKHVASLVKAGVSPSEIAVISPYNAQVSLLRSMLKESYQGIEIGSVDGFQGREKDAVVISLVRSNDKGDIGFLSDRRRLNVALTRAKRHLCVVGDGECVGQKSVFLRHMVDYFEEHAEVRFPET